MLANKNTLMGLGDGGAHVSFISDASFTTFLLTHWARDRLYGKFSVEWAVRRLTSDNARFIGLHDRGELVPGKRADVNLIDLDNLQSGTPYMAEDLPCGGQRLLQKATGYRRTLVAGVTTYLDGEPTSALPGKLVRSSTMRSLKV
jgi:N-acyl-D-aspartate/D-glutamate deacylase